MSILELLAIIAVGLILAVATQVDLNFQCSLIVAPVSPIVKRWSSSPPAL